MDAPTLIITLPSLAALVALAIMGVPVAHPVVPRDAHVGIACAHGETRNGQTAIAARLFHAAAD